MRRPPMPKVGANELPLQRRGDKSDRERVAMAIRWYLHTLFPTLYPDFLVDVAHWQWMNSTRQAIIIDHTSRAGYTKRSARTLQGWGYCTQEQKVARETDVYKIAKRVMDDERWW